MRPLEQLRGIIRGNVHAGYRWMVVCADGELVCEPCAAENARQMLRATRAPGTNPQWECVGLANSGEAETNETCAHCGRVYFEVEG